MDHEKAKLLLSVYRPGSDSADDPEFAAAVEHAERDPELGAWFQADQELSQNLQSRLREITPPADLRAKILAGSAISKRKPWYRRSRIWLSMAAGLILLLGAATLWINRPYLSGEENYVAYRKDMGTYLSRFFLLEDQSKKVEKAKAWLEAKHGVSEFEIPVGLAGSESLGCEVIDWHGHKLYLICFDTGDELVHLFLLPGGTSVDGVPEDAGVQFAQVDEKWSMATWNDGKDLYLLATLGGKELLKKSLGT